MRKKILLLILGLFLCLSTFSASGVFAEVPPDYGEGIYNDQQESKKEKEPVNATLPTGDEAIYQAFKDNDFPLYTYEEDIDGGILGISKMTAQASIFLKNILWSCTVFFGKASVWLAEASFTFDMTTAMKEFAVVLTKGLATNLTSLASTIGVCFLILALLIKFGLTGRIGELLKIAVLGIVIFTLLVFFRTNTETAINGVEDFGDSIEHELLKASPTVNSSGEVATIDYGDLGTGTIQEKSAMLLGATTFRNNVWLPYLDLQYGTTNTEDLKKEKIKIDGTEYDRIAALLNNETNDDFTGKVVKEEVDHFENKSMNHKKALGAAGSAFLYGLVSVIQLVIFFIAGLLKNVLMILVYFMFPVSIIGLFWCLIKASFDPAVHFAKSTGILIFLKGGLFTVLLVYSSVITIGFQSSYGKTGVGRFMITFLYIFMPFAVYWLRFVFLGILQGNLKTALYGFQQARTARELGKMRKAEANQQKAAQKQKEAEEKKAELKKKEAEEAAASPVESRDRSAMSESRRSDMRQRPAENDSRSENTETADPQGSTSQSSNRNRKAAEKQKAKRAAKQAKAAESKTGEDKADQVQPLDTPPGTFRSGDKIIDSETGEILSENNSNESKSGGKNRSNRSQAASTSSDRSTENTPNQDQTAINPKSSVRGSSARKAKRDKAAAKRAEQKAAEGREQLVGMANNRDGELQVQGGLYEDSPAPTSILQNAGESAARIAATPGRIKEKVAAGRYRAGRAASESKPAQAVRSGRNMINTVRSSYQGTRQQLQQEENIRWSDRTIGDQRIQNQPQEAVSGSVGSNQSNSQGSSYQGSNNRKRGYNQERRSNRSNYSNKDSESRNRYQYKSRSSRKRARFSEDNNGRNEYQNRYQNEFTSAGRKKSKQDFRKNETGVSNTRSEYTERRGKNE